jgi:transposase InsO family protein
LYSKPTRQSEKDKAAVLQLRAIHQSNYGVVRLALALEWSNKKTRRIRNLANVVAFRRQKKRRTKPGVPEVTAPENALKQFMDFKNPNRPQDGQTYERMVESGAWVQDFTHIWFMGQWMYVATIMELKTRQILGWSVGLQHDTELVYKAMLDALSKHAPPPILHSDQGSEYLSYRLQDLCRELGIILSCSDRGSPWQNGFKERFYGTLKDELIAVGNFKNTKDIAELYEAIAKTIHYYNHDRIHTRLKMSPVAYATRLKQQNKNEQNKAKLQV